MHHRFLLLSTPADIYMVKYIDNFDQQSDSNQFGVILANLGTPESPSTSSVRRFLRQFLSDTRVVELPKFVWWFILNGIILTVRPRRSAKAYQEIWQEGGSPLMLNSIQQAERLQQLMNAIEADNVVVRHAMRYGEPSLARVLDELTGQGIDRLLVLPMYPQYSGSTTASIFDEVGKAFAKRRFVPDIRFMHSYARRVEYIDCLERTIRQHWAANGQADCLVMSFHGLPQEVCDDGDPYQQQCMDTARLLADSLELENWRCCFQSRFGPKAWLQPYAEEVIGKLPEAGFRTIDVICPGFSADCLETLEEVNIGYRELFLEAGGERFSYIPCLNDRPEHIEMLSHFVRQSAADWLAA